MFKCDNCHESAPPKQAPNLIVVESEVVDYVNYNADREPILSVGTQIVFEAKVCDSCAGVEKRVQDDGALTVNLRGAAATLNHLRKCNKPLNDCKVCDQIRAFYAGLPLHYLSACLADQSVPPATFSLGTLILDGWLTRRGDNKSKRRDNDSIAAMQLLKAYEDEGGKIGAH